jgi:hypothetical protein
MTPLLKPIHRRCVIPHRGKRVVVTLEPGDLITMRHERERKAYSVPIAAVYDMAVKAHVQALKAEKKALKKGRKS